MAARRRPASPLTGSVRGVLLTLAFAVAVLAGGVVIAAVFVWGLA